MREVAERTDFSKELSREDRLPSLWHCLPCETFRFSLLVKSLTVLPPYKGGIFRGAFGATFRRIVCPHQRGNCKTCLLREKCLYVALFEPSAPADFPDAAKYSHAPPPYVLNPPLTNRQAFHPGDGLDFELVLVGPALDAMPYFVYTFTEMGRQGIGRERGRYELVSVELIRARETIPIYDGKTQTLQAFPPDSTPRLQAKDDKTRAVTLEFLTPLRIKEKGKLVTHIDFPLFFDRLVQRLHLLTAFYGTPFNTQDFEFLKDKAKDIRVNAHDLYWYDWGRYSSRQKDYMKLGGLRGRITFEGDLGAFMPLLRMGERVNVGQGTSFGLGRYAMAWLSKEG